MTLEALADAGDAEAAELLADSGHICSRTERLASSRRSGASWAVVTLASTSQAWSKVAKSKVNVSVSTWRRSPLG